MSEESKKEQKLHGHYKYKPEYCQMIVDFAENGCPDTNVVINEHFCDLFDVCEDTLYNWAYEFKDFNRAFRRAREIAKRRIMDHLTKNLFYDKSMNMSEKTMALILERKFGFAPEKRIMATELHDEDDITEQARKTLKMMQNGSLSLDEGEILLNSYTKFLSIETEDELGPIVKKIKELVKKDKG